jgi:hypothetical protein
MLLEYNQKYMKKQKKNESVFLDSWVTGSCGNTTLIAFVTCHFDITFVAPIGTPAKIIINNR